MASVREIVVGCIVFWGEDERVGIVTHVEGGRATVRFDDGTQMQFSLASDVLRRVPLKPGYLICRADDPQTVGMIYEPTDTDGVPSWRVAFPPSTIATIAESGLRPAVIEDPLQRMRSGRLGTARDFNLRSVAAEYFITHHNSDLVSLGSARVDLKPHQVSVVHRVITKYPHRFMLCDEVGLGKTIEAAMIVKELRARGGAERVLVLVPAGLQRQWQFELKTKFNEPFAIYNTAVVKFLKDKGATNPWMENNSIIASHTWASWTPGRREEIASVPWDVVIVDEAHHARARLEGSSVRRTNLYRLVTELIARPEAVRRAALLVTASPLQLELHELYSLCDMLDPVLFSSEADFKRHVESLSGLNRLVETIEQDGLPGDDSRRAQIVANAAELLGEDVAELRRAIGDGGGSALVGRLRERHRLSEVLIRNRKSVVGGFQPRTAFRWDVELSDTETRVHELMEKVFEEGFERAAATGQNAIGFLMVILQKLLASSSRALLTSLEGRRERLRGGTLKQTLGADEAEQQLAEDAEAAVLVERLGTVDDSEATAFDRVIALLRTIDLDSKTRVLNQRLTDLLAEEPNAKVLIFTEFRETQEMLRKTLEGSWSVNLFHGQMSPEQKDAAVERFRTGAGPQLLVSTEAGGEGRNFQFCHLLVNYDLPWNPMKVEQRIGRVDRIGQEDPVTIFNFHVRGTIEGRILEVLERRIRIFEEAVGGLDPILGEAESDIRRALRLGREERDRQLSRLGERLERKVERARQAESKLADFIMDSKSFRAEIAQTILRQKAPVAATEFETFLVTLLRSVNAYVADPGADGSRFVQLYEPLLSEYPSLIEGQERRRVSFNPARHTDSEFIEYFGFGHPLVDALVERVTEQRHEGAAAVRSVGREQAEIETSGWQFNWRIKVGGLRPSEVLYPVFVSQDGAIDSEAGARLQKLSRFFEAESDAGNPSTAGLDEAYRAAEAATIAVRDDALEHARAETAERADIEEQRTRAAFEHRMQITRDRIEMCERTIARLEESEEENAMRVLPVWRANLERGKAELNAANDDLARALNEITQRRNPTAEYQLLNVARIELAA